MVGPNILPPPTTTSVAARSSACATPWPPPSHCFATYTDLRPCLAHVAVAKASLLHLEEQLDDGNAEQSLKRILAATAELQSAFEFIDALELGVASAGDLVEATERRLNTLEVEPLPDSLAQLPPPTFSASQFSRQLRRREKAATLDLPELVLLPPSDSAGGGQRPRTSAAEQVAFVAATAAAAAAAAAVAAPKSVDEARIRAEQVASAAASAAAAAAAAAPKSVDEAKALASAFLGRAVANTPSSFADGINGAWTAFRRFQEK